MTDSKHSPAPWKSHPIEMARGLPYVPVAAETLIAKVYSKHFGDYAQAEANGRLIAAAPELLEELQRLVDGLAEQDDEGLIEHAERFISARAAIAKATGEQA